MHTYECQKRQEQALVDRIAYFRKWSDACRACEVSGESISPTTFWDDECVYQCGVCNAGCPRCGVSLINNLDHAMFQTEEEPCFNCGYQWGKLLDDLPPKLIVDCDCEDI